MTNLEKIESDFIMSEGAELENVENWIERISKFSKVDMGGYVLMKDKDLEKKLSIKDKILLIVATRFLANKLQEELNKEPTISQFVNANEIANMLKVKATVISARLKDLKDERNIISKKAGIFSMAPYYLESFLSKLEGI